MARSNDLPPAVIHVDAPERLRLTPEESNAHEDRAVCKARGGSPLIGGERSPGRWDPACSCGWRVSSNENRREAEREWRDHRRGAVAEARAYAEGRMVWRVRVGYKGEERTRRIYVYLDRDRATQMHDGGNTWTVLESSTDGETWTAVL